MHSCRWLVAALLGWTALAAPAAAHADPRRIVVQDFEGPGAATVRADVIRSMRGVREVTLVPRQQVHDAAVRLGVSMIRPAEYVAVARDQRVTAFVTGVVRHGRGWRVTLQVRDASSGEVTWETSFAGRRARRVSRVVRRVFWRRAKDAIRSTDVPAAGSAEDLSALDDEAPPPPDLSQDDDEPEHDDGLDEELAALFNRDFLQEHSPLEAYLGLRGVNRGMRYLDDRTGLRPYDMPLAPEIALGGEWYPAAHFTNGVLAHVGLAGDFTQSLFLTSQGPNGVSYPTSDTRWSAGLRIRLPIDESRITLSAEYGHHAFSVEAAHPRDGSPDIASVDYENARFGAGTRVALGDLRLHFDAAYLYILDTGEIGQAHYFPRTTAHGIDAAVGFSYPLGSGFEVRGWIDGRLSLLDFHADEGDPVVAAGAMDRYIGATAALAWRMPPGF